MLLIGKFRQKRNPAARPEFKYKTSVFRRHIALNTPEALKNISGL